MPLVVDGDNLLGTWPGRQRSNPERRDLAFALDRFAAHSRRRVVVFFDGQWSGGPDLGPDVRSAGPGRSADDAILDFLRRQEDRRGWTVVTSDRSLGDRCRHLGARVERCDEFRPRLAAHRGPEKPEHEADLDYWLERFGHDGDP